MTQVSIEKLRPGMILERPVKNNQGVLLLDEGARVTKKNIRIFKSWGVTEFAVKGEVPGANDADRQMISQTKESDASLLKEKFADVLDDPVMVEIFNAASRQLNTDSPDDESEDRNA